MTPVESIPTHGVGPPRGLGLAGKKGRGGLWSRSDWPGLEISLSWTFSQPVFAPSSR